MSLASIRGPSLAADPDTIKVTVLAGEQAGLEYIALGKDGEFRLASDDGPLPAAVVEKIGQRFTKIRAGLADMKIQPACTFPLTVRILGGRAAYNEAAGSKASILSFTLDFDRDFELLDRAVASTMVLGCSEPPPQWAWLVDGLLGSVIAANMTKVDQFQMNASTAAAIKSEARGAPGGPSAPRGGLSVAPSARGAPGGGLLDRAASIGAASMRKILPRWGAGEAGAGEPSSPKAHEAGASRAGRAPSVTAGVSGRAAAPTDGGAGPPLSPGRAGRASSGVLGHVNAGSDSRNPTHHGASKQGQAKAQKKAQEAAQSPLHSILAGPSPKNRANYRMFTTSFVSFLAAMHPKIFPLEVLKHAHSQIGGVEKPKRDREYWQSVGRLVPNKKRTALPELEREWRQWVEGRVDGRTRGIAWVFSHAFRLMGAYPGKIALSFAGLACQLAMQALLILSFARVVDAALEKKEGELRKYVILLAVFGLASVIGSHCYAYIQSSVVTNTLRDLQVTMMRHLLAMPDSYLRDADEGSLLSYFANDINALEPTLASVFRVVQASATFALQVALMFSLDPKIAPVVIVIQFAIIVSQRAHNLGVAKASGDKQKSLSGVMSVVKEVVLGVTVIRDYGMADKAVKQFEESLTASTEANFRLRMHSMLYVTAIICFNQCLQGATLSVLGYLALNDSISKGQVSAIYLNVTTLGSASATIVNMVPDITKGSGPLQRICAFMMIPEDEEIVQVERQSALDHFFKEKQMRASRRKDGPVEAGDSGRGARAAPGAGAGAGEGVDVGPANDPLLGPGEERAPPRTITGYLKGRGARGEAKAEVTEVPGVLGAAEEVQPIECSDVGFAYRSFDSRLVVHHLSLTIRPRTSVCIVGGSGCGKSTLLGILMRNYRPTRGHIAYGGLRLHEIPRAAWKRHVRVVQQSAFIFADSVRTNIAIGRPGASEEEVVRAAQLAQVHDVIQELPEGYDTQISMKSLSGGQKQRISIARALISDPKILILDECTSALDAETERRINAMIEEASKRMTVIQVTHRLAAAEKCDEVIVLDKGRIVERGKYEELAKAGGAFARLLAHEDEFEEPIGPARTLEQLAAAICKFRPFREGDAASIEALAKCSTVEMYKAGDRVSSQETPATRLDLVISGVLAKERVCPDGRREPLGTIKQGEHTDEANLLLQSEEEAPMIAALAAAIGQAPAEQRDEHGNPAPAHRRQPWNHFNVNASTDCRVLRIPLQAVNEYLRSLPRERLLAIFPHLGDNRRALFNWKRGRQALEMGHGGRQRRFGTARPYGPRAVPAEPGEPPKPDRPSAPALEQGEPDTRPREAPGEGPAPPLPPAAPPDAPPPPPPPPPARRTESLKPQPPAEPPAEPPDPATQAEAGAAEGAAEERFNAAEPAVDDAALASARVEILALLR
eukprot:tig00020943_g16335.t1